MIYNKKLFTVEKTKSQLEICDFSITAYNFDMEEIKMRVLIWGVGQLLFQTALWIPDENIIGYIDTYNNKKEFAGKPLYKPDEVKELVYDAILVSTLWSEEVAKTCKELGIPLDKVIFVYSNVQMSDRNQDYEFIARICGSKYADFIKKRYHLIREIEIGPDKEKKEFEIDDYAHEKYYRNDYIRLKTLELLADEIKRADIQGQIAELGVFRGNFAQFLNAAFPDRKLYLFDTFEGFDEEELERELTNEIKTVTQDIYLNTSIQIVMDKMKYKNNVIIKQGFFPESLGDLEDNFAFVSLDCDWEESIYQGLVYFYPRLCDGGYIMIHDYNNMIDCAKKAVKRYESDMNTRLIKIPVCDVQGSLIITK